MSWDLGQVGGLRADGKLQSRQSQSYDMRLEPPAEDSSGASCYPYCLLSRKEAKVEPARSLLFDCSKGDGPDSCSGFADDEHSWLKGQRTPDPTRSLRLDQIFTSPGLDTVQFPLPLQNAVSSCKRIELPVMLLTSSTLPLQTLSPHAQAGGKGCILFIPSGAFHVHCASMSILPPSFPPALSKSAS